jgi:hypothetical protein
MRMAVMLAWAEMAPCKKHLAVRAMVLPVVGILVVSDEHGGRSVPSFVFHGELVDLEEAQDDESVPTTAAWKVVTLAWPAKLDRARLRPMLDHLMRQALEDERACLRDQGIELEETGCEPGECSPPDDE